MKNILFDILIFVICIGCSNRSAVDLPEHIKNQDLENLTIYQADVQPNQTIQLIREQAFGNSEDVLIGNPSQLEADRSGRVYIGDSQQKSIHVFQPDGNYLSSIGREGQGPGEFQWIGNMQILSDELFIYDPNSHRLNVFRIPENSNTAPEFLHSVVISGDNFEGIPEANFMSPRLYRIRNDGSLILFSRNSIFQYRQDPEFQGVTRYYLVNMEDETSIDTIFEMDMPEHIVTEWFTIPAPFNARGLMALSSDDRIFSVWTDDILIKVHSPDGVYERSFYYPFVNHDLNREDAINSMDDHEQLQKAVRSMELPKTWPALDRMFIDDKDRIWIATIVDDLDIFEWWVMNEEGELLTRFNWPRSKQIVKVKNGKLYARKTEEETGLEEIVRYDIKMKTVFK
ncbi:6-bladed beta-propeller protein [Fodinibius roseus]|uniref:6-bladed beta-propeller protein n=1 Tax=Fodinibius roseus TaxID=1194090 RepID=A0A1M4SEV3_9BACT|nr:6-bladed beta-propeller [Fodinibius roseus]SHE30537.1 6-bladed beta-propeller protein [Fodinibius roseus]